MHIARYRESRHAEPMIGVLRDGRVTRLESCRTISHLLTLPLAQIRHLCLTAKGATSTIDDVEMLAPVDGGTEVWAAGVTYLRSREARVQESAGFSAAYDHVYEAARPELFFKSVAWRVVGPGATVAIREDSTIDVPEPEFAVVVNRYREVVGYTICNDVSSRSIEGENPLYLPQAKLYLGGCALGPAVRPAWEIPDPYRLAITAQIVRTGRAVWSGESNTAQLARRYEDLLEHLFRADEFPWGVILSTGTCLVPELPFSLQEGDRVRIESPDIGRLENTVVRGKRDMAWLVEASWG